MDDLINSISKRAQSLTPDEIAFVFTLLATEADDFDKAIDTLVNGFNKAKKGIQSQ